MIIHTQRQFHPQCRSPWRSWALLFVLLLGVQQAGNGQNLWLGAQVGFSSPLSYGAGGGTYFKNGFHAGEPMLDLQSRFLFPNGWFVSGGFALTDYNLGLKLDRSMLQGLSFWFYPGTIDIKDLRIGFGRDIRLTERLRFLPELALHGLLERHFGSGGGWFETPGGIRVEMDSQIRKPPLMMAVSFAPSLDVRFRNGMIFRMGCRFASALGEVAGTVITVYDSNGEVVEGYDYDTVPMMLQPSFGFHYPISRIWRGKPW